jgi:cell division transport system permease protein
MLALRTALTAFRRAPLLSVLSVTTIAFSLFAFGLFGLVALNLKNALTRVEERVDGAFVAQGTKAYTIATAADEIAKYPQVAKVDVVTQSQALQDATSENSGRVRVRFLRRWHQAQTQTRDPTNVKAVAAQTAPQFVDDIRFGEE